jgi:hypothetical protein
MPAVPIIIDVVAAVAPEVTGAITGAIGAGVADVVGADVASTVVAGTTVANLAGNAILTAGTDAAIAAAQGGDAAKAAFQGAVGSVAGQIVGGEVSSALSGPSGDVIGPQQPNVFGSRELGSAGIGATSGFAGGTAGALAGGASLSSALQQGIRAGEIGGIGGLVKGISQYDFGTTPSNASEIGKLASDVAGYALPPVSGNTSQPISSVPPSSSTGTQVSGTGQTLASLPTLTGPSPTLAQSLSIAPTLGYTPTGAVFGSSDDSGQKQNVWNVGSLRNIGSAES